MQTPEQTRRLQGTLLAASPCIANHPFAGTVFLVTHHDELGITAVCLNDQSNHTFQRRCDEWIEAGLSENLLRELAGNGHSDDRVDWAPWLAPYLTPDSHVTAYTSRLYTNLEDAAAGLGKTVRLFVGQHRFAPESLDEQIEKGLWLTIPASPEILFTDLTTMWAQTVRRAGEIALCQMTGAHSLYSEFAWN